MHLSALCKPRLLTAACQKMWAYSKILRIMKITVILLLGACLQVSANGNSQKITISKKKAPLEKIFSEIKSQSGYLFFYDLEVLEKARPIDINVKNADVEEVLEICFKNQPLKYTITNKIIIVNPKKEIQEDDILYALSPPPPIEINGKITDEDGNPLAGASIKLKGTDKGVAADANGNFSIQVPDDGGILVVSYIGHIPQELAVSKTVTLNIILKREEIKMDDVVVVGYGSQKRKDLTGAVASVDASELKDLPLTRVDQALLGKLAGVQVKPSSGEPGAAPQIRIRGIGSISAGSDPLYVVDGVPMLSIQTLNPNDIESIDVLKDASATAIYGSRGSNGVIIVNTKRGKTGKAIVSFDTYAGFQKISKVPVYQTALEEAQHYFDGIKNRNIDEGNDISGDPTTWKQAVPITIIQVLEGRPTTMPGTTLDFQDNLAKVLQIAPQQQYQLSVRGGSEKVKYALGGEYLNQDGIIINSNFKRYSARANIDIKASNKLSVKMNLNPSFIDKSNVGGPAADEISSNGSRGSDIIYNAIQIPTYYKLLDEDGTYFPFGDGLDAVVSTQNPLALAKEVIRKQRSLGLLGNINLEYSIFNELKLNVLLGVNVMDIKGMSFKPKLPAFNNNPAIGTDNASMNVNWLTETTLTYNKSFKKHTISGLVGFTTQKENFESNFISSDKFPNNLVPTLSAVSGIISNGSSDIYQWSLVSYLGRVNYNYNNKYYLTASFRTDGSSRFGGDNKYGIFPSTAFAWRISEENFLKDVEISK